MKTKTVPIRLNTPSKGYVKMPAPESERCPHCGAENIGRKIYLHRVADERGAHLDCDQCAKSFALPLKGRDDQA